MAPSPLGVSLRGAPEAADPGLDAKELAFFVVSCLGGTFLAMMLGCRINLLRGCRKQERRNPPLLFLGLLVAAVLSMGGTILLEYLAGKAMVVTAAACAVSARLPPFLGGVCKTLVFAYFAEVMHALRACKACQGRRCRWPSRYRFDWLWTGFALLAFFGTVPALVLAPLVGRGTITAPGICVIEAKVSVPKYQLSIFTIYSTLLMVAFLGLTICTIGHYPVLNDVSQWHYRIRKQIFDWLPKCTAIGSNTEFGQDQPIRCPAYLVPINGRTAGRAERSCILTAFTILCTTIPTAINLSTLVYFDGEEPSWMFLLLINVDIWSNVVIIQYFSNDPLEWKDNVRNAQLAAIQCMNTRTGSQRARPRSPDTLDTAAPIRRRDYSHFDHFDHPSLGTPPSSSRRDRRGFVVYSEPASGDMFLMTPSRAAANESFMRTPSRAFTAFSDRDPFMSTTHSNLSKRSLIETSPRNQHLNGVKKSHSLATMQSESATARSELVTAASASRSATMQSEQDTVPSISATIRTRDDYDSVRAADELEHTLNNMQARSSSHRHESSISANNASQRAHSGSNATGKSWAIVGLSANDEASAIEATAIAGATSGFTVFSEPSAIAGSSILIGSSTNEASRLHVGGDVSPLSSRAELSPISSQMMQRSAQSVLREILA